MPDRPLSICLINRNFPPSQGATGYYASHLVDALRRQTGHTIHIVTVGEGDSSADITFVRPVYGGKQKLLRLIGSYKESRLLIKAGMKRSPDVYIVMTDPAILNYWASRLLKDQIWVYWSMDLFPEGFRANNLISAESFLYKRYQSRLKKGNPSYLLGLGDAQIDYLRRHYFPKVDGSCLPIGLRNEVLSTDTRETPQKQTTVGYVGNVGEAHDAELIAESLLAFVKRGFSVVLRCYGAGAQKLLSLVEGTEVNIKNHISDKELQLIDIHVVSLRHEWTHICVPSKAISAIQGGNAVLYLGSPDSDTWKMLKRAGWIIKTPTEASKTIEQITDKSLAEKKKAAREVVLDLKANYGAGLSSFFTFLENIKTRET